MKNLKMFAKISLSFTIVLIMSIITGVFSCLHVNSMNEIANNYVDVSIPATVDLWTARRAIQATEKYALETVLAVDQAELDEIEANLLEERAKLDAALDDLLKHVPQFKEHVDTIHHYLDETLNYRQEILEESAKFTAEGNARAYEIYKEDYSPIFDKVVEECVLLTDQVNTAIEQRNVLADATFKSTIIFTIILILITLAVCFVCSINLARLVVTPVKEIENAMEAVAAGEFHKVNVTYQSKDELGVLADGVRHTIEKLRVLIPDIAHLCQELGNGNFAVKSEHTDEYVGEYKDIIVSLTYVRDNLSQTMSQIDQASEQVQSGSQQVASGAQALSQGATQQASSIQELVATITELSERIRTNAEDAAEASKMSAEAGGGVAESNQHMQELMAAMAEINDKSTEIAKIIKTIDDIAFQTNILALNAAVEAARAGAAGKGFAVVADEVRNLAAKSAEAAQNTTVLIEGTVSAVENGTKLANQTANSLQEVVVNAGAVDQKIRNIASASEEQAIAVAQITTGVDQISAVVQTNSATAEESAAASEELSGQANMLKALIAQFTLQGESSSGYTAPAAFESYEAPASSDFSYATNDKY